MPRQTKSPWTGLLSRVYAVTLFAFPRRHRDAYTDEMIDAFERALIQRRCVHGFRPAAWFAVAACLNAIASGLGERRRREIGIRAALGGSSARILAGVFSRVASQLTLGALCGMLGAVALEQLLDGEMFQGQGAIVLPIVAVCMIAVGLVAAFGPARHGLRIRPTEALRDD